ncbi:MAG: NAD-dependent epimerase/dehydratase family protein [Paracoccaceae bacterium]|nr:MAG: NAD-dependent epimerase/dehydratase family protein [Paracoccaceae bacterium]
MPPLLVLGATGRIGTALRRFWPDGGPLAPVWQARDTRPGFVPWNILAAPCPVPLSQGVVLCLAGGRADDLDANTHLALAALDAARDGGARHVFLASSAAVYAPGEDLDEDAPLRPPSAYGAAKLAMESAAAERMARGGGPGLTFLRIGNVAGCDALLGRARPPGQPVTLDPVPGTSGGPLRSYIGPRSLAAVLAALAARAAAGKALPRALNIAAPRPLAMADLLRAAGLPWAFGPPDPAVIPAVTFDTARLRALVPLPGDASDPAAMVREWRDLTGAPP